MNGALAEWPNEVHLPGADRLAAHSQPHRSLSRTSTLPSRPRLRPSLGMPSMTRARSNSVCSEPSTLRGISDPALRSRRQRRLEMDSRTKTRPGGGGGGFEPPRGASRTETKLRSPTNSASYEPGRPSTVGRFPKLASEWLRLGSRSSADVREAPRTFAKVRPHDLMNHLPALGARGRILT